MILQPAEENHTDQAEQLSLFSAEELAALQHPAASLPMQGNEMTPPEIAGVRKARRPRDCAVQDKLPGF
jgi:hypothetical protein